MAVLAAHPRIVAGPEPLVPQGLNTSAVMAVMKAVVVVVVAMAAAAAVTTAAAEVDLAALVH